LNASQQTDRRDSDRFPMERDVKYRIHGRSGEESGIGSTVNMSSTGLLFTAQQVLLPGRRIDVSVSWPAELNAKCALRLVARGRIVRYSDGHAAVEIQQYEFRTQPKGAGA
jgi:hypothetical protein